MLELAGIVILGILAQWVAWKLKIPAILPLILIGLFVGPFSTLLSVDGTKWIEPIWNGKEGLFPGESLFYFVSLAISIILFEGGLTLKLTEIKNVGPVISKLITLGSLVTFFGAAIAAHFVFFWRVAARSLRPLALIRFTADSSNGVVSPRSRCLMPAAVSLRSSPKRICLSWSCSSSSRSASRMTSLAEW